MDALDRMFQVLVRTIRTHHPQLLTAPFTVADLYQQIMPYRHFRRELQLETNQEYEMVLMELLTGARGYVEVDEQLRDELGKELASASPEPSRVRAFADAHVSISKAAQASLAQAGAESVRAGRSLSPSSSPIMDGSRCRFCAADLPPGRATNFCPSCGQNLRVLNCPACGAEMEAGWKYCVACGKGVGAAD